MHTTLSYSISNHHQASPRREGESKLRKRVASGCFTGSLHYRDAEDDRGRSSSSNVRHAEASDADASQLAQPILQSPTDAVAWHGIARKSPSQLQSISRHWWVCFCQITDRAYDARFHHHLGANLELLMLWSQSITVCLLTRTGGTKLLIAAWSVIFQFDRRRFCCIRRTLGAVVCVASRLAWPDSECLHF